MNRELTTEDIGEILGIESAASVMRRAEECCGYEMRRIELTNEPQVLALQAEAALLVKEERHLEERLREAPLPEGNSEHRRPIAYSRAITLILTIAGFVFTLLSFDPFRLGWKRYLYCLGIAVVVPYLADTVIETWNARKLIKSFAAVAFVAGLASLILLAVIRGDLLAHELTAQSAVVLMDDAPPPASQPDFYGPALVLLRIVMALLALAMELGAGLALHDSWSLKATSGDGWERLRERQTVIHRRMLALTDEITMLKNEPGAFAARFWRNFERTLAKHTFRGAALKVFMITLLMLPFAHLHAATADRTAIVVALDLTQSVATAGPDGKTDFAKNVHAVGELLGQVPAGANITVLGITDRSFAEPYILLRATVPADPGYFGERLVSARKELVTAWKKKVEHLEPEFLSTDILGALSIAAQMFEGSLAQRKVLIILSDMRHHTADLDLESDRSVANSVPRRKQSIMATPAMLQGIEVYVLGVDGAGKSVAYWQSLQKFWTKYFHNVGAVLRSYSVLRELPAPLK